MSMALIVSRKSRDISTRIGSVIVDVKNDVISTGYNGLPRGLADNIERYENKEYKYAVGSHAEENAIINAGRIGVPVIGCKIYVLWQPCASCARFIIQAGLSEVIYYHNFPGTSTRTEYWNESMNMSVKMFAEANVKLRSYVGPLFEMKGLYAGDEWLPELV